MKYYNDFLKLGLFSKEQANQIIGNSNAAKVYLRNSLKEGSIKKVRHNYYTVMSLESKQPIPSRFAIGSQINPSAFISHHTAFEYYGMANQVFNEVFVSSIKKFKEFEFDGYKYRYLPTQLSFGVTKLARSIQVTDMERTILDNIKDFSKHGGLEELLHCLSMVTLVDQSKLLTYLEEYGNQFLYQKAGYILSFFPPMQLPPEFFRTCKEKIGKSRRYLFEGIQQYSLKYLSEWQLYVPHQLMEPIDTSGAPLV